MKSLCFCLLLLIPCTIFASDTLVVKRLNVSIGLNAGLSKIRNFNNSKLYFINDELNTAQSYSSERSNIGRSFGLGGNVSYSIIPTISLDGSLSLNQRKRSFNLEGQVLYGDIADDFVISNSIGEITQQEFITSLSIGFSFSLDKNDRFQLLFGGIFDYYLKSENIWSKEQVDIFDIVNETEINPPVTSEIVTSFPGYTHSAGIYSGFSYKVKKQRRDIGKLNLILYTELKKRGTYRNILNSIKGDYFILRLDYFLN